MYHNIFKREEKKYLLTKEQKVLLLKEIKEYLREDEYFKSTICNIYYDNLNNDLLINSIDKPIYKTKVRIRSYKIPSINDEIFLEIKNKYKGVVQKRRIKTTLKEFYQYLETGKFNNKEQIMKEIDYYFKHYKLTPFIFIAYDRESYRGKDNNNLRITFDGNLRSRNNNLKLELGDFGKKYFNKDYYIMEIKTLDSMPLWLVRSLSKLKIYPTSFSKAGKIYEKINRREDIIYDK